MVEGRGGTVLPRRRPVAAREISADLALAADTLEEAAFESRFRTTDRAELAAAGQALSDPVWQACGF